MKGPCQSLEEAVSVAHDVAALVASEVAGG
jgi:hypothetical protein